MNRRTFVTTGAALALAGWAAPALAEWPQKTFETTSFEETLAQLIGNAEVVEQSDMLKTPSIAENGAQVRVEVRPPMKNVERIDLLVDKNPVPLTSRFSMQPRSVPYAAVNLKMRETSNVIALVRADGKVYREVREVRVTAGGCK